MHWKTLWSCFGRLFHTHAHRNVTYCREYGSICLYVTCRLSLQNCCNWVYLCQVKDGWPVFLPKTISKEPADKTSIWIIMLQIHIWSLWSDWQSSSVAITTLLLVVLHWHILRIFSRKKKKKYYIKLSVLPSN